MSRVLYYAAASLDGYLATPEHGLDWLLALDNDPDGALGWNGVDSRIGALVMGRATYDWLVTGPLAEPGSTWPHRQPTWVRTRRAPAEPNPGGDIRFTSADAATVVGQMRAAAGDADLWCVGGGQTAAWLLEAGLVDELWISIAPVVLGAGIPLLPVPARLQTLAVDRNRDFAAVRYRVLPSP